MDSGQSRRRIVALVAAYAVALQALLSAFLPLGSLVRFDALAMICSHADGGAGDVPGQHDSPCAALCAAIAQSMSGPLPPVIAAVASPPQAFVQIRPVGVEVRLRIAWIDSHAPRGPPA